ncbi:MAG TPA: hypothetical protein VI653_23120 [Steroidobacteraceae bacterium]
MALNPETLTNAMASHAAALGVFDMVNLHEPKSAPGNHITCAIWVQDMVPASSGLAATSFRITFNVRIYSPMLQEPQDAIDPEVLNAVDLLLTDYIGNFTLGGLLREVDIRGIDGNPLRVDAGYLTQDGRTYRVMTISLPVVINDLYTEAP